MLWHWLARAAALAVLVGAGLFLGLHPSATYQYEREGPPYGQTITTGNCISPWNQFTAHYYPPSTEQGPYAQENEESADAACDTALAGRTHLGVTALVVGGVLLAVSFLPLARRDRRNERGLVEP